MNQTLQTLQYIVSKYGVDTNQRSPIHLPITRHGGLTTLWRELDFKVGAEIGVEQGRFSEEIFRDNPDVHLFCVDPWRAYSRYKDHVSQSKLDRFFEEAQERLKGKNATFVRKTSMEAVEDFADESLDFVFIDGNHHFDFVTPDIIYWSRKVRPGGIVSGHDYRHEGKEKPPLPFHVIQAIHAYTDAHQIKPWFLVKKDKCPSWMYVKS